MRTAIAILLTCIAASVASAQVPAISMSVGNDGTMNTYIAGELDAPGPDVLKVLLQDEDNATFKCTAIPAHREYLKKLSNEKGVLAVRVGVGGTFSKEEELQYPIYGVVLGKSALVLVPAVCTFKVEVKAGVPIHVGDPAVGYEIKSSRAFKAGESFNALSINGGSAYLSTMWAGPTVNGPDTVPQVSLFSRAFLKYRAPMIAAWQTERALPQDFHY